MGVKIRELADDAVTLKEILKVHYQIRLSVLFRILVLM